MWKEKMLQLGSLTALAWMGACALSPRDSHRSALLPVTDRVSLPWSAAERDKRVLIGTSVAGEQGATQEASVCSPHRLTAQRPYRVVPLARPSGLESVAILDAETAELIDEYTCECIGSGSGGCNVWHQGDAFWCSKGCTYCDGYSGPKTDDIAQ